MEGLETVEISYSELERTLRIDSEFYKRINLKFLDTIVHKKPQSLTQFVKVSDGNHLSISEHFTENGIPYYRGGDIYNFYIEQTANPLRIPKEIYNIGNMKRSHLKKGDVLISIVGAIIGNLSLVKTEEKATCSCKLAILRPKSIKPELLAVFLKSKFGQNQIQKFRRGTGQTGFILEDFDQILIPEFGHEFSAKIESLIAKSYSNHEDSIANYSNADQLLLQELGLDNFAPSQEPVNIKSISDSFCTSGRLDAEYYQVKYDEIDKRISSHETFHIDEVFEIQTSSSPSNYESSGIKVIKTKNIRIPSIELDGITDYTNLDGLRIKKGDLLFASMGVGSLGRISFIDEGNLVATIDGTIKLLRIKKEFEGELYEVPTLLYLTSGIGQEAIYKHIIGSTGIISISRRNIGDLIIPKLDIQKRRHLTDLVLKSIDLRRQSEHLLEVAKRAVEIAIEEDEDEAMKFIKQETAS